MKTDTAPLDYFTASNGTAIRITRRVDVGPALMVDGHEMTPLDVAALREYFKYDADPRSRDQCRCYVYRYVHETGRMDHPFKRARGVRLWLLHHSPTRHVIGWLWLHVLNDIQRQNWCDRYAAKHPELCVCQVFEAGFIEYKRDEYDCGCDVPLPWDAEEKKTGTPSEGGFWCYCTTDPGAAV